jgi:hypothetical protein
MLQKYVRDHFRLPIGEPCRILIGMVALTEEDVAAIQAAYHESGELSAAAEVRKRFQAIQGERAREWARMIAAWRPIEVKPRPHKSA